MLKLAATGYLLLRRKKRRNPLLRCEPAALLGQHVVEFSLQLYELALTTFTGAGASCYLDVAAQADARSACRRRWRRCSGRRRSGK